MHRPFLAFGLCLAAALGAQEPGPSASAPATRKAASGDPMTGGYSEEEFKKLHELNQAQPPAPKGEWVVLPGGAKAYLSLPAGKPPFPAVTVIHEWWGLNAHIQHWADRLAAEGYAALAVDLYGGVVAKDADTALQAMRAVDPGKARATLLDAHAFLAKDQRVLARKRGSIGWCFGGGQSLQLALAAKDLDAAVIYYGRLVSEPEAVQGIHAAILGVFARRDRNPDPKSVDAFEQALRAAKKDHAIFRYDADHAFANPSGQRYDQAAARAAWEETRKFLAAKLKT
ncbi:MAG: dienelactone hydrolase family protein [Planctomycetes bacterium]|nr:dienelactone hydrolase family protein [Planctomycetota bacterium]